MSKYKIRFFTTDSSSLRQLFRYGLVGIATNFTGYILYIAITSIGIGAKVAMTFLYVLGVVISFFGNRRWVFHGNGKIVSAMCRYMIAYILGYCINFSLLAYFVDVVGWPHIYVQAASILIVAAFIYLSLRVYVFPVAASSDRYLK